MFRDVARVTDIPAGALYKKSEQCWRSHDIGSSVDGDDALRLVGAVSGQVQLERLLLVGRAGQAGAARHHRETGGIELLLEPVAHCRRCGRALRR